MLLLLAIAAWVVTDWLDPFDDESFNATAWASCTTDESRAAMARDLVRNHLRTGMPRSDVTALLGSPIVLHGPTDAGGNPLRGDETYAYYIGQWSLYGFDDAFVYVHLNAAGRVIGAEINGY